MTLAKLHVPMYGWFTGNRGEVLCDLRSSALNRDDASAAQRAPTKNALAA